MPAGCAKEVQVYEPFSRCAGRRLTGGAWHARRECIARPVEDTGDNPLEVWRALSVITKTIALVD